VLVDASWGPRGALPIPACLIHAAYGRVLERRDEAKGPS